MNLSDGAAEPNLSMPAVHDLACDPVLLWEPKLCKVECKPIKVFDDEIESIRKRLLTSMVYYDGVGLAAPQIGLFVQAAIMRPNGTEKFIVNPKILERDGSSRDVEGCLSLPGCSSRGNRGPNLGRLFRHQKIKVEYYDVAGERHEEELKDFDARVFQHEEEHLRGLFFVDHLSNIYKDRVFARFRMFKQFYAKNVSDPVKA